MDKVGEIKWLIYKIKDEFQFTFNLDKFFMVDEIMFRYKGKYCPIRQYIPNKSIKQGVKI